MTNYRPSLFPAYLTIIIIGQSNILKRVKRKIVGFLEKYRSGVIRVEFHSERKDRRIECALSALTVSGWFFRRHR